MSVCIGYVSAHNNFWALTLQINSGCISIRKKYSATLHKHSTITFISSYFFPVGIQAHVLIFRSLAGICTSSTANSLRLFNPYGNSSTDGGMLHVCKSSVWKAVCDYTFDCTTEGRAACKQLGYGGAHMSEIVTDV